MVFYQTRSEIKVTLDSSAMDDDQQKEFNEMISKSMQKEYKLIINRYETLYKEVEKLKAPNSGEIDVVGLGGGTEGGLYKNIRSNMFLEGRDCFGKEFLIDDTLGKKEWELINEHKQIGNYKCYKAELSDGEGKTPNIIAWYTPDIPLSHGPGDYWGLPGLILEVNNGMLKISCSKIIVNPKNGIEIKKPKKGKRVTKQEFDEIYDEKVKQFQERYK